MASVWPPEISIVYHRRYQGGGKGPYLSLLFCDVTQTKTNARLKSIYLASPKILGWLRYCCVWFVD